MDARVIGDPDGSATADAAADSGTGTMPRKDNPCEVGVDYSGDVLPAGASRQATLVQGGFGFIEGPVWVPDQGALYFSDMDFSSGDAQGPAATIWRYEPGNPIEAFLENANSNGLALDLDGTILACTHDLQTLSNYDPVTTARTPRALQFEGKNFLSTNDLVIRSDGTIYFTDPDWQLGSRDPQLDMTGVYRATPDGQVFLINGTLRNPNGIALSPDEGTLYVGSAESDILAYPVAADGSTGTSAVFASPGASDGMAVDCAGNLYVTSGAVVVYSPAGAELERITTADNPSNAAFGGADRRTLFITAGQGLYSIELQVPGFPY